MTYSFSRKPELILGRWENIQYNHFSFWLDNHLYDNAKPEQCLKIHVQFKLSRL